MIFRRLAAFLVGALSHLAVRQSVGAQGQTNANNMVLSSILYANQTLSSSGGIFELGFYSLPGSTSPSSYMLAIWYAHVSPKTLVWLADRNFKVSQSAYLQLSSDGRLLLFDPSSGNSQPLWASTNETRINVTGAYLLSTGNLVILDNMNSTLWQSFDTPTDTLLPGQRYFSNSSRKLQSWNTPTDWGQGRFSRAWDSNQHFYLFWNLTNGPKAYWPIDWSSYPQSIRETWGFLKFTTDIAYVDDTGLGGLYVANYTTNETSRLLNSSGVPGRLRRVTLDREGSLRLYSWTLGTSTNWSVEDDDLAEPIMSCGVEGICGPYGLCTSAQTDLQCACPEEGFEYIDPADTFQGCKRTVQLLPSQCNSSNSLRLTTLTGIDYPDSDYSVLNHSFSSCSLKCLEDCRCEGMTYSYTNHSCWLKEGALWNGNYGFSGGLINSYLKISALSQPSGSAPAPTPAPLPRKHSVSKLKLALVIGLIGFIGVLFISFFCFMMLRIRKLRNLAIETKLESLLSSPVLKFTYKELKVATNNFREEIGRGGFGSVFKGEVGGAKHAVAVKRLQKLDPEGEKGFIAEVMTIGSIHHVNLVTLSGYCAEGPHMLLVYEYVEQGSLDKFLFDPETPILEWRIRFQIAVEIARALMYLHEECRQYKIIHRDIKPQNILLDRLFHVKLADFGLAKLMNREHTRIMTLHGGTIGYLAPECTLEHSPITPKIDVFSYGMVLLEIVGGRKNYIYECPETLKNYFPAWAMEKMKSGAYPEIVDPSLGADFDISQVELLVQIAIWCINDRPEVRPSMGLVLRMLERLVPVDQPVPRPHYFVDTSGSQREDEGQPFSSGSQREDEEQPFTTGSTFSIAVI